MYVYIVLVRCRFRRVGEGRVERGWGIIGGRGSEALSFWCG